MRQRFLAVVFTLLCLSLLLSGCGSTPPALTDEPSPATTEPDLTPEFAVSSLDILPPEISVGESTEITAVVENTGGAAGTHAVKLIVDGNTADITETESVSPGSSIVVKFTLTEQVAGSYQITVGNLNAELTVTEPAVVPEATVSPATVSPAPTSTDTSREVELKYDDGTFSDTASQGSGWGYAVLFQPPGTPFTVTALSIMIMPVEGVAIEDTAAYVEIWDSSLNTVYTQDMATADYSFSRNWMNLEPGITVDGDFRVVFYPEYTDASDLIFICYDTGETNTASEFVRAGGKLTDWPQAVEERTPEATTNWMIRVTGSYISSE